jgi:tetratricopeptide (TPR) repeat protein
MEEHWAYLASIGFFLILAYLILTIKRPKLITIVSIPIVVIYGVLTNINSSHWKEEMSFYRYNLEFIEAPLSIIPRLEFMDVLTKRGLYKEALDEAAFVLSTHPQNWIAYLKRGDTLRAMRKFPEAKEAYQNALKIDYFCWQANQRLKSLAEESGGVYKEEVDPALSPLEAKIVSLIRMGDFDQALYALSQAISASPTPNLYTFAGITFGKMDSYEEAIEAFNAALKIDQNHLLALYNLAVTYENKNLPEKAEEIRKRIRQIK